MPVWRNALTAVVVGMPLVAPAARGDSIADVKGALVIAGGNLRFDNAPVWRRIIELAGGPGAPVVVVPAASAEPGRRGPTVAETLKSYGARADWVPIAPLLTGTNYKLAARDPSTIGKLESAKGVWFLGGDQQRITAALVNENGSRTPALEAIWQAYRHGAVVGGSSAGAAIMSRSMFADARESLGTMQFGIEKNAVRAGLGFLGDDWFVDQHFLARGRFARALCAMHKCGFKYGVGVDEDTAIVFQNRAFHVVGYKGAVVMDIAGAKIDDALSAFNLRDARLTHLDAGDSMDARTRQVTVSEHKAKDRKVDPQDAGFQPRYQKPSPVSDMLAPWRLYSAMVQALDSDTGVVTGLAFALSGEKKELGFEIKIYRGKDTFGWSSDQGGNDTYTIVNMHVDITPVHMADPLYQRR